MDEDLRLRRGCARGFLSVAICWTISMLIAYAICRSVFHHYCLTVIDVDPIMYIRSLIHSFQPPQAVHLLDLIDILRRLPLRHNT